MKGLISQTSLIYIQLLVLANKDDIRLSLTIPSVWWCLHVGGQLYGKGWHGISSWCYALLALCGGNPMVTGGLFSQMNGLSSNEELWYILCYKLEQAHISDALTHWGWVRPMGVSKLTIIGSDNGLSPDQCWDIVNWTFGNKLQWNLNRNSYIFTQENTFETVVSKLAAILSWPQCANADMT